MRFSSVEAKLQQQRQEAGLRKQPEAGKPHLVLSVARGAGAPRRGAVVRGVHAAAKLEALAAEAEVRAAVGAAACGGETG